MYLPSAKLCISVTIRTLQHWDTAREPKVALHYLKFVPTNNLRTNENEVIQKAALSMTKWNKNKTNKKKTDFY